ncbi:hypothetical protein niasHT_036826 [Heterodera trifolii]|uniref:MATH domain-containing protein n=1 Tax=Heterodera trifolii TaxID=157864 RepID=A0ABD2IQY9_9BILA
MNMNKLSDRMNRLLSTGVDSDVHFLVGQGDKQERIKQYKTVLASQKEANNPVEIPDVDVEAFKTILSFIYTDDLSGVNGKNAIDVLYAAKKYNLPSLVKACVKIPIKELSNVFIAFSKARLLQEKALCWASEQCKQKCMENSPKNRRKMLGPALYKIRFPIIEKHMLLLIDWFCLDLTSDELVSVLLYHLSGALSTLYPLPFAVHGRSAKFTGKLSLKIEKFSEFARQKEFSRKYSDAIYIDGFQWKIFAQLQSKFGTKYLGFFIQCNADDYGTDWSCTCSATIYVVPLNEENTHYNRSSKTIDQSFCSKNGQNWGFDEFMAIEKLMHPGRVSSGVLTSDELVSVLLYHSSAALSTLYPLPFPVHGRSAKSTGKLTLKIEKFSEFARQKELSRKYSDAIYIDGFQWKIFAQIQSTSVTKYLGFFIQCNADDYGSDWSCTCSATIYVVLLNEENTHYNRSSKTFDQSFCSKNGQNWGFDEFMAIEKLMHPGRGWYNKTEDTVTLSALLTTVGF